MILIRLDELKAAASARAPGYFEAVISRGKIEGDKLAISAAEYTLIRARYSVPITPALVATYNARWVACRACIDSVCRVCPNTELERLKADGRCPLGLWPVESPSGVERR